MSDDAPASTLDILGDLAAEVTRPRGTPCRIAEMRRDRPELVEQWDRALAARRVSARPTYDQIAGWFTDHGFAMTRNTPERHLRNPRCAWCADELSA